MAEESLFRKIICCCFGQDYDETGHGANRPPVDEVSKEGEGLVLNEVSGKTKPLDCIRGTNVQEGDAGGITQQKDTSKKGEGLVLDEPSKEVEVYLSGSPSTAGIRGTNVQEVETGGQQIGSTYFPAENIPGDAPALPNLQEEAGDAPVVEEAGDAPVVAQHPHLNLEEAGDAPVVEEAGDELVVAQHPHLNLEEAGDALVVPQRLHLKPRLNLPSFARKFNPKRVGLAQKVNHTPSQKKEINRKLTAKKIAKFTKDKEESKKKKGGLYQGIVSQQADW